MPKIAFPRSSDFAIIKDLKNSLDRQHQELRCHGAPQSCEAEQQVEVSTSVSFVDVTRPAVDMYKELPVIEAKLPHDFFYPFVVYDSDSSANSAANALIVRWSPFLVFLCCVTLWLS